MKIEANINRNRAESAELPGNGSVTMFKMQGNSMYPALCDGDFGIVQPCNPKVLHIGDVVVLRRQGKYIAHRLIKIETFRNEMLFTTQGDKNKFSDPPFRENVLCGRITSFRRGDTIESVFSFPQRVYCFNSLNFRLAALFCRNIRFFIILHRKRLNTTSRSFVNNLEIIGLTVRKQFIANLILSILQGVVPFALIVCVKWLVDVLTKSGGAIPMSWMNQNILLVLTALMFLLSGILSALNGYFRGKLSCAVTRHAHELLHRKHTELNLSYYENHIQQDKIHRAAREADYRPVKIMNELLAMAKSGISLIVMVLLFFHIKWYLVALLLLAIVPGVLVRLKYAGRYYRLQKIQSPEERQKSYYNHILTGIPFARELRLFGFSAVFLNRFDLLEEKLHNERQQLQRSEMFADIFAQIFAVFLVFSSLISVVYLMAAGKISIGVVVMFFFVFQRGYSVINEAFHSMTELIEDSTFLNDFIDFINLPLLDKIAVAKQPKPLRSGISVENVFFHYETSKRDALIDVTLNIPAGKTVAFVGANGSGKTTLIKLLCGFYTPQRGTIRYDDDDLNELDRVALREQVTAVFQDFALYNITAGENIALGNIMQPFDLVKAKIAAEDAGVADILDQLPNGYETMLGNLFKTGEELSIGQWQKIAIARAFYRNSPILFMDEPSSALDVNSEKQLLNKLKDLSKGKTVVIISHRLSTVRWADIIYVLDKGRVVESGCHDELMEKSGKYFELIQTSKEFD